MPLLVEVCPSFRASWEGHLREYGNDVLYVAAGDLAHHLLSQHSSNDMSSFPAVAAAVEQLLVDGSLWVKEFVTIGVLESVQNVWGNNGVDPEIFASHLGPEGMQQWKALNNFWSGTAN